MTESSGDPPGADRPLPDSPLSRREASESRRTVGDPEPAVPIQSHIRAARSEFESQVAHARAEFEEANERIKQRTGRDLILATLIGVAAGAMLLSSLIFVKQLFLVFALAAVLLGVYEFARALRVSGRRVDVVPQLVAAGVLVLSGYFFEAW